MSPKGLLPEARVLAIASHVCYGYVGNTMVTSVLRLLGLDVCALNTVHFSNHTGYQQVKGTRTSAKEILDIFDGLKQSHLLDFDALLTGYAPGADAVKAVGSIGKELKLNASGKPGSFFWALDPVMGDDGKLYVDEDVVPAYKESLKYADLILPNQFEAETLSGTKIDTPQDLAAAIHKLHVDYDIPHVIVTSVRFPPSQSKPGLGSDNGSSTSLSVFGSTRQSFGLPRMFRVEIPEIDCAFRGTGDMFAALTLARFRETAWEAGVAQNPSWLSPDDVLDPRQLPLKKAVEKVLASMHIILEKTKAARDDELAKMDLKGLSDHELHLRQAKASEVRVARSVDDLKNPVILYRAEPF